MVTRPKILDRAEDAGYEVFTGPFNVNVIGVRSVVRIANKFDDWMYLVYQDDDGEWIEKVYPITTDPGTYWLENPSNVDGTAMLAPGEYKYKLGLHPRKDGYEALVQAGEVAVYRDNDGDNILDPTKGPFWGWFGINIHHAGTDSSQVNKWSAGCQVFKRLEDWYQFMYIIKRSVSMYGETITYRLIGD